MTTEEADKIVNIWGKYLEHVFGRLNMLFSLAGGKIPESLLPYPKKTLEKALHIMDKHYYDVGNKRGMKLMRETMMLLVLYDDDDKTIKCAGEAFQDETKRKRIVNAIKDWQKNLVNYAKVTNGR